MLAYCTHQWRNGTWAKAMMKGLAEKVAQRCTRSTPSCSDKLPCVTTMVVRTRMMVMMLTHLPAVAQSSSIQNLDLVNSSNNNNNNNININNNNNNNNNNNMINLDMSALQQGVLVQKQHFSPSAEPKRRVQAQAQSYIVEKPFSHATCQPCFLDGTPCSKGRAMSGIMQ